MDEREQLARRAIEAYAETDWAEIVRGLASPGLVYEETGTGRRLEGIDAVIDGLRSWKTAFPDVHAEVGRVVSAGDTTALEIVWVGTHTGPLDTGAGVLAPTGATLRTAATMWQRWAGGVLVHEHHHLDMLAMLSQLGALPAPASA